MTLPLYARIIFLSLLVPTAAHAVPQDKKEFRILAIGDSTTAGTPAFRSPAETPPDGEGDETSQYAYWIMKKRPGWRVINRGINGQRSDQILSRFAKELETAKPDAVVMLAGVNDLYQGRSAQTVTANLENMYRLARERNLKTVACTILPYEGAGTAVQKRIAEVNRWIREYSRAQGLIFCDTFTVLIDPAGVFRLTSSPDGLHPSVEGYRSMGEKIAEVLTAPAS